jgi:acetylornithine deacetylase
MNFGTDIPFFQGNHTRYLYGPGSILVSHTADEQVTLGDLERAVEDYKKLILHAVEGSAKK